jgi:DNA-binding transcriptional LysR family regulator
MYKSGLMELEAVVAIARRGSFRAAALDLDVSPTAIGNAVASLEKRLGVRLFNRTTRNVALTSAGREYVEAIAPALSDIRNATQSVADHGRKPTGTLGFSCSLAGGRQLLTPFVFEFLRRYDEMKVEIVTDGRLIDIIKDGFLCKPFYLAQPRNVVPKYARANPANKPDQIASPWKPPALLSRRPMNHTLSQKGIPARFRSP